MKKLLLIIPTQDRYVCIDRYLYYLSNTKVKDFIDVVILDSSENTSVKYLVENYSQDNKNIFYDFIKYEKSSFFVDKKVYNSIIKYMRFYDYIMFSSDRTIVDVEKIYCILFGLKKDIDFIVYSNGEYRLSYYKDPKRLLEEWAWKITSMASVIFASSFLKKAVKIFDLKDKRFKGLWLMASIFYVIDGRDFDSLVYTDKSIIIENINGINSFWIQEKGAIQQWSKVWCEVIENLPNTYDDIKDKVILYHDKNTKTFSIMGLLRMKSTGNLNISHINTYKKYILKSSNTNIFFFYIISILPIKNILAILRKIYRKLKIRRN